MFLIKLIYYLKKLKKKKKKKGLNSRIFLKEINIFFKKKAEIFRI
jgi:hypothetical protein